MAGFTNFGGSDDFVRFRLNSDGKVSTEFFIRGGTLISIGTNRQDKPMPSCYSPTADSWRQGLPVTGSSPISALLRLNPDGVLDAGFGFGGGLLTSFGPGSISETRALVLQPDGKLVEAGTALFFGSDIDGDGIRKATSISPSFATTATGAWIRLSVSVGVP